MLGTSPEHRTAYMWTRVIIRFMGRNDIVRQGLLRRQETSKALMVGTGKAMRHCIGPGDPRRGQRQRLPAWDGRHRGKEEMLPFGFPSFFQSQHPGIFLPETTALRPRGPLRQTWPGRVSVTNAGMEA